MNENANYVTGKLNRFEYSDFLFCKGALGASTNSDAIIKLIEMAKPILVKRVNASKKGR